MSSQGTQKLSSSPLCLPLLKFSYATVSSESIAPIPWIHLSSKNSLFAVFETSPVQLENGCVEERQKFKVLRDPEVMVREDFERCVRCVVDLPLAGRIGPQCFVGRRPSCNGSSTEHHVSSNPRSDCDCQSPNDCYEISHAQWTGDRNQTQSIPCLQCFRYDVFKSALPRMRITTRP